MVKWLCIHLAGALASFGEEAGNVQRGTSDRPTRSALLGLAGAALGVRRDDNVGQAGLSASFSVSTLTLDPGVLLTDFHTYEGVQQTRVFYRTRAHALASGSRNTAITRREYRCGGHWLAAYRLKPDATLTLEMLEDAFREPVFPLWLGRKSCSPSRPLSPKIIEGLTVEDAFSRFYENTIPNGGLIATDDRSNIGDTNRQLRRNKRTDQPVNRQTWTFKTRDEFEFMTSGAAGEKQGGRDGD